MALKLGIIGIGNQGTHHVELMEHCPNFELVAVADTNPDRLAWAAETLPNVARFDTTEAMLDSGLVEACIIAVPHYDHPKCAIACMERGVHVMVEKPAGVYTKQIREMNEVADAHPEVKFGMMFNQRTTEVYRKLREYIQSGKYGQIRRVNWLITTWYRPQAYYDSGSWRATWAGEGGGVLMNQCPHQLDLLQWLCGMPVKVHAKVKYGKWHDIEVEDEATVYMEFANGASGVFITSTGDARGTNRLEIQMDKAVFVVGRTDLHIEEFEMSEPEFSATTTEPFAKMPFKAFDEDFGATQYPHAKVTNAWGDAILHGTELFADGREGINGAMLANAIQLSAFLDREVTLPIDEDLYYEELMKRVATSKLKTNVKQVVANTAGTFGGAK